jgi:chromosome segregation ATPase
MGLSPEEREAEAKRLLAEARAAHREADRERNRARKLAGRIARRMQHALSAARARIDADRAAIDAKVAKFTTAQSEFHTASAADRARLREAWAEFEARQKRLAEEWDEVNNFQARQAAALDARAAELTARESTATDNRKRIEREVAALREEAAALESRIRNARQVVEELEQRRAEPRTESFAPIPVAAESPAESQIALDRAADRDLGKWAAELDERDERLRQDRAAVQALFARVTTEKAALADRRRVLTEQFAELAAARAQWQEAERATVAEMEQLARTLRAREAELDARQEQLVRADARRREDAYELWQLRLRLEAWQAKIVAYELRWHTEREEMEADFARREANLIQRQSALARGADDIDAIPFAMVVPEVPALPTELVTLRDELDRMAAVLLEAELPEPPESELPWGSDEVPTGEADVDVLPFEPAARAA